MAGALRLVIVCLSLCCTQAVANDRRRIDIDSIYSVTMNIVRGEAGDTYAILLDHDGESNQVWERVFPVQDSSRPNVSVIVSAKRDDQLIGVRIWRNDLELEVVFINLNDKSATFQSYLLPELLSLARRPSSSLQMVAPGKFEIFEAGKPTHSLECLRNGVVLLDGKPYSEGMIFDVGKASQNSFLRRDSSSVLSSDRKRDDAETITTQTRVVAWLLLTGAVVVGVAMLLWKRQ